MSSNFNLVDTKSWSLNGKKGQNKKDIEKFEKQLEDLIYSTDDGDIIKGKILELEN
jgi:hypothetical protein